MRSMDDRVVLWTPVVALVVLGLWGVASGATTSTRLPSAATVVLVTALPILLLWRRRAPLAVLLAAIAGWWALGIVMSASVAAVFTVVVAIYSCGRYASRPWGYVGIPITILAVVMTSFVDPASGTAWEALTWSLNVLWIFGIGAWLRQKDRLIALGAVEADERARAAAAEERLRIARELHDVLAHSVSLMVVQAEAAEEMLEPDPVAARRALRHIQDAGRSALAETSTLLRGLRASGPSGEWGPTSEAGLEALEGLLARMRGAGLVIRDQVAVPAHLSDEVSATAYRVIQESLTNALRHAGVGVVVVLTVRELEAGLDIDITDHGGRGSFDAPGHGLRGMHERVHEVGGTLEYGRSDRGFRVHVTLPLAKTHAGADLQ